MYSYKRSVNTSAQLSIITYMHITRLRPPIEIRNDTYGPYDCCRYVLKKRYRLVSTADTI